MILRDARRDDVPAIVRMLADDALGAARERLEDPLPQAYYDAYEAIAGDPSNRLLVAEVDGEVVGTLQLSFLRHISRQGSTRAEIESVRVAGHRRGTGLGREMIGQAIEIARARGCAMVQLASDVSRTDARRFYERLGFVASHVGMKLALH
jgi:ribosomal protein S18 acetylase RimI-like enzyme